MSRLIIGSTIVATCSIAAVWFVLSGDHTRTDESQTPSDTHGSTQRKHTSHEFDADASRHSSPQRPPAGDVAELRREVRELRAELDARGTAPPSEPQAAPSAPAPEAMPSPERIAEAERAWTDEYSAQLEDALLEQSTDRAWAQDTRNQAEVAFGAKLPDSDIGDTTCGESLCRVDITHRTAQGHEDLLASVRDGFPLPGAALLVPVDDDAGHSTRIYLARAGTELPVPQSTVRDFIEPE